MCVPQKPPPVTCFSSTTRTPWQAGEGQQSKQRPFTFNRFPPRLGDKGSTTNCSGVFFVFLFLTDGDCN